MKKILLGIPLIALLSISANAQNDSAQVEMKFDQLEQQIQQLQENNKVTQNELQELSTRDNILQKNVNGLYNSNKALSSRLDSLNNLLKESNDAVTKLNEQLTEQRQELSGQISETRETTSKSVSELDDALSKNTLFWIIAVLSVTLLSILAFIFLRKKVSDNENSVDERLSSTKRELIDEGILVDRSMLEHLENQLKFIQEERQAQPESQKGEQDHSLALKVADEIVRIEKNISRMDEDTKGLKQLSKAVERIRDNFASNGYEMVDMLNTPYEEGLKASVTFRPDSDMNGEQPKITRIIKPQVNYKGVMIQQAQIEVSQPE